MNPISCRFICMLIGHNWDGKGAGFAGGFTPRFMCARCGRKWTVSRPLWVPSPPPLQSHPLMQRIGIECLRPRPVDPLIFGSAMHPDRTSPERTTP